MFQVWHTFMYVFIVVYTNICRNYLICILHICLPKTYIFSLILLNGNDDGQEGMSINKFIRQKPYHKCNKDEQCFFVQIELSQPVGDGTSYEEKGLQDSFLSFFCKLLYHYLSLLLLTQWFFCDISTLPQIAIPSRTPVRIPKQHWSFIYDNTVYISAYHSASSTSGEFQAFKGHASVLQS